jgi:DNA (cytosine-5)-methyltransferase 1
MKHYFNVCDVRGNEIEPVDIITFGSPCQDLSIAGKRAGLKHAENGDEETTRSGLFMEAVRIIKEMRNATNNDRPRFAVWENVPGAFSSGKGEDFRIVLEELAKIKDPTVSIPRPKDGKWRNAGEIVGNGFSIAWRVLDAQFWGVPQRRRRIYLVADFAGESAGKILFESESVSGDIEQSETPRERTARDVEGSVRETILFEPRSQDGEPRIHESGISPTLNTAQGGQRQPCVAFSFDSLSSNSMKSSNPHSGCREVDVAKCLDTTDPNPSKNQGGIAIVQPQTLKIRSGCDGGGKGALIQDNLSATLGCNNDQTLFVPTYCLQGNGIDRADTAGCNVASTQSARQYKSATDLVVEKKRKYIIRRLTPTECARLQGFPDTWGKLSTIAEMSDEDYQFWTECRKVKATIDGKKFQPKTKEQTIKWYNKLHTDSAEYKMWGNGIALPCASYVLSGIANEGAKTLGSLFDGSGGFPLAGAMNGIVPIWASEIEPYPIAVTKSRFNQIK